MQNPAFWPCTFSYFFSFSLEVKRKSLCPNHRAHTRKENGMSPQLFPARSLNPQSIIVRPLTRPSLAFNRRKWDNRSICRISYSDFFSNYVAGLKIRAGPISNNSRSESRAYLTNIYAQKKFGFSVSIVNPSWPGRAGFV